MAKRYRYSFVKTKEAEKGKLSVGLAAASLILFLAAVLTAFALDGAYGFIVGGICLFATMLSAYGFILGLLSFQRKSVCIVPVLLVLFLMGSLWWDGWAFF